MTKFLDKCLIIPNSMNKFHNKFIFKIFLIYLFRKVSIYMEIRPKWYNKFFICFYFELKNFYHNEYIFKIFGKKNGKINSIYNY